MSISSAASAATDLGAEGMTPILVVEDEAEVRQVLVQMLEALGWAATGTADAPEAIQYLQEQRPSLALVDLFLPSGNGVEVLNSAREKYPDLPVVVMSGMGSAGVEDLLQVHRPTAVLAKPFSLVELATTVRSLSG